MANTTMSAKNTWSEGLVMDFSPDNTLATCLTSALNATLLTFNGNEMSLQNDMGNGRVETAYLPEGYVPVGACEFGDIIYIVSYNPLTNKSLIGCFPSPERNIESEEISDLTLSLLNSDFIKEDHTIRSMSVKKVLLGSKDMHPGDKFIIYGSDSVTPNGNKLSDYGNKSLLHGTFPKMVKIHVVSIEDNGKVNYLDSSVKWYDNYYISDVMEKGGKPDIDSYRTLLKSAYSIFQSKNSGKLAILAELELIDSFNCTYSVIPEVVDITSKEVVGEVDSNYTVYLHSSWSTSNFDVNPVGLAIIESDWIGNGTYRLPALDSESGEYIYSNPLEFRIPIEKSNDVKIEFSRIYQMENSTSYDNYKRDCLESKFEDSTDISYYSYIDSSHNNPTVGWGKDYKGTKRRDVTRITLVKTDKGLYSRGDNRGEYYFNLDKFDKVDGKTKAYTRCIDNSYTEIQSKYLTDDVVNNYFKKDVTTELAVVSIPLGIVVNDKKENSEENSKYGRRLLPSDLSDLVWKIKVAPCMPYGVLEHYAVELTIDFSKVGTNSTDLTLWRYYNEGELSSLTYGLEVNVDSSRKVKEVRIDFYDNQGAAATYINSNRESYSGVFTELFGLNGNNTNYRLSYPIDKEGNRVPHAGEKYDGLEYIKGLVYFNGTGKPEYLEKSDTVDTEKKGNRENWYLDDGGSLYANFLYKALVTITYGVTNEIGEFKEESLLQERYSRWYWTNSMYNDYYYNTSDFDILPIELYLGGACEISSTDKYNLMLSLYFNSSMNVNSEDFKKLSVGATVVHINLDGSGKGNVRLKSEFGLLENYNTFALLKSSYEYLRSEIRLGEKYISCPNTKLISEEGEPEFNELVPLIDSNLDLSRGKVENEGPEYIKAIYDREELNSNPDIWDDSTSYIDTFTFEFEDSLIENDNFKYEYNGLEYPTQGLVTKNGKEISENGILFTLTGVSFNKLGFADREEEVISVPTVKPILRSQANRELLGLLKNTSGNWYFTKVLAYSQGANKDREGCVQWRYYSDINLSTSEKPTIWLGLGNSFPNSPRLLSGLKELGVSSPIVPVILTNEGSNNRWYIDGSATKWGPNNIDMSQDEAPNWSKNNGSCVMFLALYKQDSGLYLFNDGAVNRNMGLSLLNIGDAVFSLLTSIYYQSNDVEDYEGYKYTNITKVSNWLETWNRHIIVTSRPDDLGATNYNTYIGFLNGFNFAEYLELLDNNFSEESLKIAAKSNNINIKLQSLTQLIDFLFLIPSTGDLEREYVKSSRKILTLIYYENSEDPVPSPDTFEKLLWYRGAGGKLITLDGSLKIPTKKSYSESNKVVGDLLTSNVGFQTISIPKAYKLIRYDLDLILWVSRYPTTKLYLLGHGNHDSDRKWFTGSSKDAELFNGTLQVVY